MITSHDFEMTKSDAAGTLYYHVGKFVAEASDARVSVLLSKSRPTLVEPNPIPPTPLEVPPITTRTVQSPHQCPPTPSLNLDTITTPIRRQSCRLLAQKARLEEQDKPPSTPRRSARLALKKANEKTDIPSPVEMTRTRRKLQF